MTDNLNATLSALKAGGTDGIPLRDVLALTCPMHMGDAALILGCHNDLTAMRDPERRAELMRAMAALRYEYADAMLAARAGEGE